MWMYEFFIIIQDINNQADGFYMLNSCHGQQEPLYKSQLYMRLISLEV